MDLSYKQEVTVGSLVILAIVLFVVGTSWLSGKSIAADEDEFWKIQFKTAGNLKASSVVKISGVPVGKVERIRLEDVGKVLVMVTLPDRIVPAGRRIGPDRRGRLRGRRRDRVQPGRRSAAACPAIGSSSAARRGASATWRRPLATGPTACSSARNRS